MKPFLLIISLMVLGAPSCKKEETPECIADKIRSIKEGKVWNPPARIYRYRYWGETVYYLPPHCCDIPGLLYSETCDPICAPAGGFTGKGDGGCDDFFEQRSQEELIWEDPRGYGNH